MNTKDDNTTAHLIRCYANVQEVIRFLDTKAAVVFTLAGVMLGALAAKPTDWFEWAKCPLVVAVVFTILAMALALRAVWPSHGPKENHQLTLLFPALHPRFGGWPRKGRSIDALVFDKLAVPLTSESVNKEYGTQLAYLHKTLIRKIAALRGSIFAVFVALICGGICHFGKKPEEKSNVPIKVEARCTIDDSSPSPPSPPSP